VVAWVGPWRRRQPRWRLLDAFIAAAVAVAVTAVEMGGVNEDVLNGFGLVPVQNQPVPSP
jgi:hypothetical protein